MKKILCFVSLMLVVFTRINISKATCEDRNISWTVDGERSLTVSANATEGTEIVVKIEPFDDDSIYGECWRGIDFTTDEGSFEKEYDLCSNTGYSITWKLTCDNTTKEAEETIWIPPDAPNNVTAEQVEELSLVLKWKSPLGYISAYQIIVDGSTYIQNGTETFFKVENLTSDTSYEIQVLAKGKKLWSEPSESIFVQTLKSLDPPSLVLGDITNTTVELIWTHPGGDGFEYTVKWQEKSEECTAHTNLSTIIVENLTPFTNYSFSLRVSERERSGDWSGVLPVQTNPGIPFPPVNVKEIDKGSRFISIEWNEPLPSRGPVITYVVTWQLMRHALSKSRPSLLTNQTSIVLKGLKPARNYRIEVSATTEAGTGNSSRPITVQTLAEPPFPPRNIHVTETTSNNISLEWDYPNRKTEYRGIINQFTVQWNTLGGPSDSLNTTTNRSTIENLKPFTTYSIRLRSWNEAGPGNWSDDIEEKTQADIPTPPRDLRKKSVTNSSIEMTWEEPFPEVGTILRYKLRWTNMRSKQVLEREVLTTSHLIVKLSPYTNYSIEVQAQTDAGYGDWSDPVIIQTEEGVPHHPLNLTEKSVSNTSIEVEWTSPGDSNGPIILYKIKSRDLASNTVLEEETQYTFYTFQGLKPYTNYSIQVRAKTEADYGPWSAQLLLRTAAGVPSAPSRVQRKNTTDTSIEMEWAEPLPNVGPITTYRVEWRYLKTSDTTAEYGETRQLSYIIANLTSFSNYSVRVQAETTAGAGDWSKPLTIQTDIGVPFVPRNLEVGQVTNLTLQVSWEEPQPYRGPIESYAIRWGSGEAVTSELNYTITSLSPHTNYNVSVRAKTEAGYGNWSDFLTVKTEIGIPSAPRNFDVELVTNFTIEVSWKEPEPCRGPIVSYNIVWGSQEATTTELKYRITDLSPYASYNVSVRAQTQAGYGSWSKVLQVKTKIGIPSIPQNVSYEEKNATYIRLAWLEPDPTNGPLQSYRVRWSAVGESEMLTVMTPVNSHEFFGLFPYTEYVFQVSASTIAGFGRSSAFFTTRTGIAAPSIVTITSLEVRNSSTLLVEWEAGGLYPGPTSFELLVQKEPGQCERLPSLHSLLNGSKSREEWQQTTRLIIPELEAYSRYRVSISLKTEAGEALNSNTSTLTPAKVPGPPKNVRVNCEEKSTEAEVRWSIPKNPNAKIAHYFVEYGIEYLGYRKMSVSVRRDACEEQKVSLTGLRPERDYKILVWAVGEGVKEEGQKASPNTACILPAGVPPLGNPQWVEIHSTDYPFQLILTWNDVVFSDAMGSLIEYSVIVGKSESMGPATKGKLAYEVPSWANYSSGLSEFYQATPPRWNPFIKNDNEEDPLDCKFVGENDQHLTLQCILGQEINCAMNKTNCNGPLKADTYYWIKLRAFTRGGFSETGPLVTKTGKKSKSSLVGGLVGGFIVVLFCLAGVYFMKRKGGFERVRKIIESRVLQSINAAPQSEAPVELETYQHGKFIKIQNFCEHVRIMLSDSHLRFSEEFENLRLNSPKFPCTAAEMEENRHKNRWMNIFPYDHSRVKLLPLGDEPASDFVNANYVVGDSSLREYIASQGPLAHTVDDFWRMIWEQSSTMIVMLTQLIERGKVKCERYWPDEKEPKFYGDIQVRLISESMLSSYIIRVFHVQLGSQERMVKQMHFTHWPDFGCPERPEDLINFVRAVRDHLPRIRPGPILVHCSAGVGRTGTFIAVDRLAQKLKHSDSVNIYETVMELRQHRINMVQTEDQYIYIHLCVQQLVEEILHPQNREMIEPIYSNVGDTGV